MKNFFILLSLLMSRDPVLLAYLFYMRPKEKIVLLGITLADQACFCGSSKPLDISEHYNSTAMMKCREVKFVCTSIRNTLTTKIPQLGCFYGRFKTKTTYQACIKKFCGNMPQRLIWTSSVLGVLGQQNFCIFFYLCPQKYQQYESQLTELIGKLVSRVVWGEFEKILP